MTDFDPNPGQQRVIDARSGIHVVDAGAGTGKTFTITRRYAALLEDGHDPDDVLLVTFTTNAAEEAKERVMHTGVASQSELRDAPIGTFHSICNDLLSRFGVDAPHLIGIEDHITDSTTILENEVIERDRFRTFLGEFLEAHPEHHDHYRLLWDPSGLLGLITKLAAKGIFPTADGWYRNGEAYLDGDRETFRDCFEAANEPNVGTNGPIQSDLTNALSGYDRNYTLPPGAPTEYEVRGDGNAINRDWAERSFAEDRSELKDFVHDVYHEYIAFALRHNYITFPFLQLFAFVLLCEDHAVRESVRFEHVMVDEFQDTSEIQFKLALLLAETNTLCAVGDWKQSIYGFQYAAVENIREFDDRLEQYAEALNADHERIEYPVDDVTRLSLRRNYRSTQSILDLSEQSLTLPATNSDEVDPAIADEITALESTADHDESVIEGFRSDEEHDAILERITTIVDNERYALDDGLPSYGDIAVLTRNRRFGRELQSRAREIGLPMAYQGGVQLYDTDQALCCLAWLRILVDPDSDRGWAVVLEKAGYRLDEIRHILNTGAYPDDMLAFRERLLALGSLGAVARAVMDRYGFEDAFADAVVSVIETAHETTGGTTGDVVRYLEDSLDQEADFEISDSPGGDAVTVQTIHSAKGLEYPIVIIADINRHHFPSSGGGGGSPIRYQDPIGLRQTKVYSAGHGMPHVYDNWRYRILSACLGSEYDEERRLLYVAMTRAERHLLFSAGEEPSPFFEELPIAGESVDPDLGEMVHRTTEQATLQISVEVPDRPIGQSPHSLMDDSVFDAVEDGRGTDFGSAVHDFAEAYAEGRPVTPDGDDERAVAGFIDSLSGTLRTEESVYLPVTVGGERVTISGMVDLVHVTDDRVEVVDYKTDLTDHAESEYRKQLSVYYHVVRDAYPDREVTAALFYTVDDRLQPIDPLSLADLERLVDVTVREETPEMLETVGGQR